jgi:hypothetical protein
MGLDASGSLLSEALRAAMQGRNLLLPLRSFSFSFAPGWMEEYEQEAIPIAE